MSIVRRLLAVVAVLRNKLRGVRAERFGVLSRIRALEAEAQEARQLNRRIAELTDVVEELLVPLAAERRQQAPEVLERYRTAL
ncbi:MAG: DUF6752 domain-containing protein [Nocardioides sp.]|uniref:DUF6752 domain-containing protein n=1 Tax=Nocardioides sp. TaxID=35761 RepID=UPI003F03C764